MVTNYGATVGTGWTYILTDKVPTASGANSFTLDATANTIRIFTMKMDTEGQNQTDLKHIAAETSTTPNTGKRKYSVNINGRLVKESTSIYTDMNTVELQLLAWQATNHAILYLLCQWTDGGTTYMKQFRNGNSTSYYYLKCDLRNFKLTNDGVKHILIQTQVEDRTI